MVAAAQWFDSISESRHDGWAFNGICLKGGNTQAVRIPVLSAVNADMVRLEAWQSQKTEGFFEKLTNLDVASGQRVLGSPAVVRRLVPGLQVSDKHALYRYDIDGLTYLVPALFFIDRLFLSNRTAAKYLFQPGMLESSVDPASVRTTDSITLRLPPTMYASKCSLARAKLTAWLAMDATARKAWAGVWAAATSGRIDTALPKITMTGRVGGFALGDQRFVSWSRELSFDLGLPEKIILKGRGGRMRILKTR